MIDAVRFGAVMTRSARADAHKNGESAKLQEACQQFEGMLWAQIWKKTLLAAQPSGETSEPWRQMKELSVEMAAEELSKSGGAGLWRVLYEQASRSLSQADGEDGADDGR